MTTSSLLKELKLLCRDLHAATKTHTPTAASLWSAWQTTASIPRWQPRWKKSRFMSR
ncbi:Uncharacterised protein [Mycobacteroides abscessus subsp. massiliense]|nr:Uncharacterised protein [Mycobacteroides abscessus subsp. massiliense]